MKFTLMKYTIKIGDIIHDFSNKRIEIIELEHLSDKAVEEVLKAEHHH